MILVAMHKAKPPYGVPYPYKVIEELKFENNHEFDFDPLSNKDWYKFLSTCKNKEGEYLPRFYPDGIPVVYRVYIWGGKFSGKTLFPGKDENGNKLNLMEYGQLEPLDDDM